MKKILALVLALATVLCFAACTPTTNAPEGDNGDNGTTNKGIAKENIKVGFIFLHDDKSTYDKNFMDAAKEAQKNLGLTDEQVIFKYPVDEKEECYETAADLVDQGCNIIFADSFGHEPFILKAAKEFPNVQFCHATGTMAHTENVANFHNAFASIYEGRYLAGVAAGLKLNEMIEAGEFTAEEALMGYVGAYPYAEVISGYTSFYLGAKSVCPTVKMDVNFTGSWFSPDAERDVANALMDRGAKLISQHADSLGAPSACEARKVPNVSYNGSTKDVCPETFIVSSRINWAPYFEYMVNCVIKGEAIAADWTGTLATNSVVLTDINTDVAAAGTKEKLDAVKKDLMEGKIKVFDTNNFTVKNEKLTTYLADVDTDDAFTPDTEAIANGIFEESAKRSAPYFDINIDGITRLDLDEK